MKIRRANDQQAIVVCTIAELQHIQTAYWLTSHHFRQLATSEPEEWKAEQYMYVAQGYEEYHDIVAEAVAGEPRHEATALRNEIENLKTENRF